MADPLFAQGTTATIKDEPSGTATTLLNLIDIGGRSRTKPTARVDGLSDTEEKFKVISKANLGELQLVFQFDDDAIATNQFKLLETRWTNNQLVTVSPNFPGAFDNTTKLVEYKGYITNIEEQGASRDATDPMRYTVTLKLTN